MLVSEKIGGLPVLSWVFDYGPVAALLIVFFATFGAVWILQEFEGIPRSDKRRRYKAFLYGEALCIPALVLMVVIALQFSAAHDGFYTRRWWHILLLLAGWAGSILLEIGAVRGRQYTLREEFAPHKLWHTIAVGVVFYWIASTLIPVAVDIYSGGRVVAAILVLIPIVGFLYSNLLDAGSTWRVWELRRR